MPIVPVPVALARHIIATTMLRDRASIPELLGGVILRPQQRAAAARVASLIHANGGALLAEPVGLGKTYTALAVAALLGESITLVIPASLRDMWRASLEQCGLSGTIVTHEALSRGRAPGVVTGLVIVDEAHRLRSATAQRYALLADCCRRARVLLITATPVQNRAADLATQLALFLGRRAWQMSDGELAEHVVRDAAIDAPGRPELDGPHRVTLATSDDCLEEILSLPPPVPASDESTAAALLTYGLVHQWTSSRAALVAALGRRRARGLALLAALESGRLPTCAELSAWTHHDDSLQLAFPELVLAAHEADVNIAALKATVDRHLSGIETLLRHMRSSHDPDIERADTIRRLRRAHPGERILAFSQYAETVNALRSRLSHDAGVAALTAKGARVAGGRVTRADVLTQFTPRRDGRPEVKPAERIDLLLTTDLLSEGLNLQEASVIVHLDLPWNPARLDQRVGRALRLGSRHAVVTVYAIAPPAPAERLLRLETRLRAKLGVAQHAIGVAGRILPSIVAAPHRRGIAEHHSAVDTRLRRWIDASGDGSCVSGVPVAAVCCDLWGFLAAVDDVDGVRLVADIGDGIETARSSTDVERALDACDSPGTIVNETRALAVVAKLNRWLSAQRGAFSVDLRAATAARGRRATLARVAQSLARVPRHQRSLIAPLADAARAVATAPLGEGAERILETLARAPLPDEAWLRSIAAFGEVNARKTDEPGSGTGREMASPNRPRGLVALILLEPASTAL